MNETFYTLFKLVPSKINFIILEESYLKKNKSHSDLDTKGFRKIHYRTQWVGE